MKGKKFSAAEKHFNDEMQKYKKELERLRLCNIDLTEKQLQQTEYIKKLEKENAEHKKEIEELNKHFSLTPAELKSLINTHDVIKTFGKIVEGMPIRGIKNNIFSYFYCLSINFIKSIENFLRFCSTYSIYETKFYIFRVVTVEI